VLIKEAKQQEYLRSKALAAEIEEEKRQKILMDEQNKIKSIETQKKQLAEQFKAKEDAYELDRLA
jgi:hypothetical protein